MLGSSCAAARTRAWCSRSLDHPVPEISSCALLRQARRSCARPVPGSSLFQDFQRGTFRINEQLTFAGFEPAEQQSGCTCIVGHNRHAGVRPLFQRIGRNRGDQRLGLQSIPAAGGRLQGHSGLFHDFHHAGVWFCRATGHFAQSLLLEKGF